MFSIDKCFSFLLVAPERRIPENAVLARIYRTVLLLHILIIVVYAAVNPKTAPCGRVPSARVPPDDDDDDETSSVDDHCALPSPPSCVRNTTAAAAADSHCLRFGRRRSSRTGRFKVSFAPHEHHRRAIVTGNTTTGRGTGQVLLQYTSYRSGRRLSGRNATSTVHREKL